MAQGQERPNQAADDSNLYFGPFRLERDIRLWRGEQVVELRPRSLAVLRYLAARPGQLVTEEELLKRLWPGIYVTKTVLRVCVHAIRQALQEGPSAPAYVQTVGRHGYRFIGAVSDRPTAIGQQSKDAPEPPSPPSHVTQHTQSRTPHFVGQEAELVRLRTSFERAQQGERQVVFLFGEPGIGKAT